MLDGAAGRLPLAGDRQALEATGLRIRPSGGWRSHEICFNPETRRYTTLPNHPGDMPKGTLRAILRQAAIEPELFVKK